MTAPQQTCTPSACLPHGGCCICEPSGGETPAGKRARPASTRSSLSAVGIGAVAAVLEPVVPTGVAHRSVPPAFVMVALEVGAMTIVARPEMPCVVAARLLPARPVPARLVPARSVPARPRRIVLEPLRPGLWFEVPARRVSMMHERRAIMQEDAEVQRGHHIRVRGGVPVGGCRRRQHGDGAKRDGEKKIPVHGSSFTSVHKHAQKPATGRLNGA
jgi:hypothetical protein